VGNGNKKVISSVDVQCGRVEVLLTEMEEIERHPRGHPTDYSQTRLRLRLSEELPWRKNGEK
jgi:hypothetical protein